MNVYIGGRHGMQRPTGAISFRLCAFALEIRGHAACAARCRLPAANSGTTTYCGARSRLEPRRAPAARASSGKASIIAALDGILTFVRITRSRQTDGARLRRVSRESGAKTRAQAARLLSGRRRGDKHAQRPRLMTLCRRDVGVPPRGFSCGEGASRDA